MASQVSNTRLIRDNALTVTTALPAASGNVTSTGIFIGTANYKPEEIVFELAIPACPNNTSTTDTYTYAFYSSPDNSTWTAVSPAQSIAVAGVASVGSAAVVLRTALPPVVGAYIAVKITATSGTGNNTTQSLIFSLLS